MTRHDPQKQIGDQERPALIMQEYQPPRIISFGCILLVTKGSGGDYGDECTSGKQPGDEEEA